MTRQRRHMEHRCCECKATSYTEDRVVIRFPKAAKNCQGLNCRIPQPEDELRYLQALRCAHVMSTHLYETTSLLALVSRGH
jgi:hypothetical protein